MKKPNTGILYLLLIIICFSCEESEEGSNNEITDSWLLFEQGYSIGGPEYTIKEINPEPPQLITLEKGNRFSSTIQGLKEYRFYLILDDERSDAKILSLYKDAPNEQPENVDKLEHSYLIDLNDNELKLYYRYCIEGCHLAFKRSGPITIPTD